MPDVHTVIVQLEAPKGDDPGRVTSGCYIIDDGMLVMTHPDGKPIDAERFRHVLEHDQNPAAIARKLTREVRLHLKGMTAAQEKFNRRIDYGKTSVA